MRIHSYGYDSDYLKGKDDCLNVHHIGKSFLGELLTSPHLAGSRTSIVFIGHSMGGLVIKKAYILAKQDPTFQDLANRFKVIYFLATPHRGADSAALLKNILRLAYDRPYVADLGRNSGAIQVINDEFRHFSASLELWSFYETQNMFGTLIVDPESAVLGYPEEKQIPMTADHRSICKFETPLDPNYIILRNSLASTVGKATKAMTELDTARVQCQMKDIKSYLGLSDMFDFEEDLLAAREARAADSCRWITEKDHFLDWRDGKSRESRILWVNGKPASGKSVLAGYVVDSLQALGQPCSSFFFKHGDKSKSALASCLRSLAFQMASGDDEVRSAILGLRRDGIQLNHVDERTLWRILFLSGIFEACTSNHYWVIDALDECSSSSTLLDPMLARLHASTPLRIFITSRDTPDLDQGFSALRPGTVRPFAMSVADTHDDLKLLIGARIAGLAVVGDENRAQLVERILSDSKGSFLWTILVLKEISNCHSKKEINRILADVPRGMEQLYTRILAAMAKESHGQELTKAILLWASCALRPMTIGELNGALILDIEDTFPHLAESIVALCGQLVVLDKLGKVQMIHETAREFLLRDCIGSQFAIRPTAAHTRMAKVCLQYLVGDEMKPPRTSRRRSSTNAPSKRSDFAVYAHTAFSYHLSKADTQAEDVFQLLEQFLKSNVLSWIEAISDARNLVQLIRSTKHLRSYLDSCSVARPPLDPRIRALKQWTADLPRLAAKFANALITSPSAIHSLIPPFCPTSSMVYNASGQSRRITLLGVSTEQWDDRLSSFNFRDGLPSTLSYGEEFLAIGLTTGVVLLYYANSHQQHKALNHGEVVKFIKFKHRTDWMATCGMKATKVWNIRTGEIVYNFESPQRPLAAEFDKNMLLVASHKNYIACWDLETDTPRAFERPWTDSLEPGSPPPRRAPCALSISLSHGVLAAAYSGQPITIWDLDENAYVGCCGKKLPSGETSSHLVVALAFNPNPSIALLAVAYLDGDLALLDPLTDTQLECFRANCQTLAASPNGRLLAAGAGSGMVHVYEFDTLKLLYRVKSTDAFIKQLSFAMDSLRFADIRGSQCSIWEPAALLRDTLSDDTSGTSSTSIVDAVSLDMKAKITVSLVHPSGEAIFCGKEDGTVLLYYRKTAASVRILYRHKSSVRLLAWLGEKTAILSVDASNRMFLYRVQKAPGFGWLEEPSVIFQSRLESEAAIVDVLVAPLADKFIISTRESDHLFTSQGEKTGDRVYKAAPGFRKWTSHPESPRHMVYIDNVSIHIYRWKDWSEVKSLSIETGDHFAFLKSSHQYVLRKEKKILLELADKDGSTRTNALITLTIPPMISRLGGNAGMDTKPASVLSSAVRSSQAMVEKDVIAISHPLAMLGVKIAVLAQRVAHVVGIVEPNRVVFIDSSSWLCSADLDDSDRAVGDESLPAASDVFRHFFIPYDWFAGRRDIVCGLVQRDVILARGGDLAIVRGGFEHSERVVADW